MFDENKRRNITPRLMNPSKHVPLLKMHRMIILYSFHKWVYIQAYVPSVPALQVYKINSTLNYYNTNNLLVTKFFVVDTKFIALHKENIRDFVTQSRKL